MHVLKGKTNVKQTTVLCKGHWSILSCSLFAAMTVHSTSHCTTHVYSASLFSVLLVSDYPLVQSRKGDIAQTVFKANVLWIHSVCMQIPNETPTQLLY